VAYSTAFNPCYSPLINLATTPPTEVVKLSSAVDKYGLLSPDIFFNKVKKVLSSNPNEGTQFEIGKTTIFQVFPKRLVTDSYIVRNLLNRKERDLGKIIVGRTFKNRLWLVGKSALQHG
jgi:hypothetical protein